MIMPIIITCLTLTLTIPSLPISMFITKTTGGSEPSVYPLLIEIMIYTAAIKLLLTKEIPGCGIIFTEPGMPIIKAGMTS
jgi:hypothetical protein